MLPALLQMLQNALAGGDSVCFMLGQTGTGKTFTSTAIQDAVTQQLFALFPQEAATACISAFELQGNTAMRDLLRPGKCAPNSWVPNLALGSQCVNLLTATMPCSKPNVLTDENGVAQVVGAHAAPVGSREELERAARVSAANRRTRGTNRNTDGSSRSHAFLRLTFAARGHQAEGTFTLIDLAGSERNADSAQHDAESRKEATQINSSLATLKECLRQRALHLRGAKACFTTLSLP